ncbi:hypothetical protein PUR61_34900 [Streptomyces sp. BE20]|uniref:hypothetical protein n=1 Tax=unclassified Streptomyces TaxID=2593676 RepID=UPI002E763B9F|nr:MULTISPECIES: hypothetical protein [unclassified Streptomyces]MED7954666.1 hypothetical protein [Streptomyces sp. BE303]MEE1827343.1 hypothetical protein [Streptomyces sp. BE20]
MRSVEDFIAAAARSGKFLEIDTAEAVANPRVVDIHLEHSAGHEFIVMVREDRGEARILFEDYLFDAVPVHRVLEFLDLLASCEVVLALNRSGRLLSLTVSLPEGDWIDRRTCANDFSEWERSVGERG